MPPNVPKLSGDGGVADGVRCSATLGAGMPGLPFRDFRFDSFGIFTRDAQLHLPRIAGTIRFRGVTDGCEGNAVRSEKTFHDAEL